MVREGYYFGLPPLLLGLFAFGIASRTGVLAGSLLVFLALFIFYFFRDPDRAIPSDAGGIVSPGDGRVVVIKEEAFAGRPGKRISIFLAVWNVHVNRSPAAGILTRLEYKPGKFMAAWSESASLDNEQNVFTLQSEHGELVFKQIAGWVARRVVSWKKQGDTLARGERVGLVRFGSRVDVWMPENADVLVKVGDHVKGGSSTLARMRGVLGAKTGNHEALRQANQKKEPGEGAA
jgi:phosphatidylserine decarboxylase